VNAVSFHAQFDCTNCDGVGILRPFDFSHRQEAVMRRVVHFGLIGLVLATCASCSQQAKKREMVRGHVTYRGTTLPGGTIVFTPDVERGGDGPLATAEIKPDGSYNLQTGIDDGAASGPYRVTIASEAPVVPDASKRAVVLPQTYSDPEKSGLKREVKVGEVNVIDFNLD
jgi:hypothetical protein